MSLSINTEKRKRQFNAIIVAAFKLGRDDDCVKLTLPVVYVC